MNKDANQRPNDGLRISPIMNLYQAAKYMHITVRQLIGLLSEDNCKLSYNVVGNRVIIHRDVIDEWSKQGHMGHEFRNITLAELVDDDDRPYFLTTP